ARLLEADPKTKGRYEVFNFGVPGYSSYSGKHLLIDQVLRFQPDLLIIGYGFNDWKYTPHNLEDAQEPARNNFFYRLRMNLRKLRTYALLDHWLYSTLVKRMMPDNPKAFHHAVSPEKYFENIETMLKIAQENKIPVILLNTNFLNDYTLHALKKLSAAY